MTKRLLSVLIALLLMTAFALPTAISESLSQFPIVEEPIELTFYAWFHPVTQNYNDLLVWNTYEEMTNIKINWIQVPSDSNEERLTLMFATDDLPDAIYKGNLSNSRIVEYAREGYLMPLNDYMTPDNAPNLLALFDRIPELRRGVTQNDGKIYSLGYFNDCSSLLVGARLFFNTEWMNRVDHPEFPTTLDEFVDLLRSFKEKDANGNGDPGDEIPFGTQGVDGMWTPFTGSFGLYNHGTTNTNFDVGEDGKVRFIPTAPEYRELMRYIRTMYAEGLISQEVFTEKAESNIANASSNRYGVIYGANSQVAGRYEGEFVGLPAALIGPNGDQMYSLAGAKIYGAGHFAITYKNQYPAETLRWIDYFYGEEGSTMLFLGIRGETYEVDENGENYYLDWVMNDPEGRTFDEMVGSFTSWGGGGNPVILLDRTFLGGEAHPIPKAAAQAMTPYLPKETWEAFTFTDEESEVIASIGNDITSYAAEMRAQFVTGKMSLDDDWDAYVAEFDKMGLANYVAVYQSAYERDISK